MFSSFHGLPVHALVLHVAVVLAPLAGLVGLAFLVPKWRAILKWPLVAVTGIALATLFVTKESGENLRSSLGAELTSPGNLSGPLVAEHARLGGDLLIAALVLFLLSVVAVGLKLRVANVWVGMGSAVAVAAAAIFVLVLTYRTGEAGAKAVWNPSGTQDYSSAGK